MAVYVSLIIVGLCFSSEMLLMFHKILLQGFQQRTAKWPVVVISKASSINNPLCYVVVMTIQVIY